jgi:ubiquinone/menaquinone biosynthesis C-methylase UbiE/DNA-binding transcriptional ArsR family regulator
MSSSNPVSSQQITRLFRILSDETRFRLLRLLWKEELTVNELAAITQLAQPRISNHLKILREEKLIIERRDRSWRYYRVDQNQLIGSAKLLLPALEQSWQENAHYEADDKRLAEVLTAREQRPEGTFFDQLAAQWDDIRSSLFGDELGRGILRSFLPSGLTVADVGTGTGYVVHLFGPIAKKIIAIDNSDAMLEQARLGAEAAGLTNVEFRKANAEESSLEKEEADLITLVQVLHHFEHPEIILRNLVAGLKPGGLMIISDFLDHQEAWLHERFHHRWSGFPRNEVMGWFEQCGLTMQSFDVLPGKVYESSKEISLRVPDGFTAIGKKK